MKCHRQHLVPNPETPVFRLASMLALTMLLGGCLPGRGEGWVVGSLTVANCDDGEPLQTGPAPENYDLKAGFYVGDPLFDSTDAESVRRSSVTIRIQQTSNQVEQEDSLMLQLQDVRAAARAFARGDPLPVAECFDLAGCPSGNVVLRARLNLYASCPDNNSSLVAASDAVRLSAAPLEPDRCLLPGEPSAPTCPILSAEDQQALDQLCETDFDDRSGAPLINQILGRNDVRDGELFTGAACLYLCALGNARRGQSPDELEEFDLDFGQRIAGIFSFNLVDGRARELEDCARATGRVFGMFDFEMVRSRTAQAFP